MAKLHVEESPEGASMTAEEKMGMQHHFDMCAKGGYPKPPSEEMKAIGDPTPSFFYYTGFEKDGMPPQPIWIDTEGPGTPCSFSIGMQYNPDPKASGWCEIPEW